MSKRHQKDFVLYFQLLLIGLCLLLLSSCDELNKSKDSNELLNASLEGLKCDVDFLYSKVKSLEEENSELSYKLLLLEIENESNTCANFCVSNGFGDGFKTVKSSTGCFFVSLKEVSPYLSGYKLVFSIGNPSLATHTNAKLKLCWNRSYQNWKNDKEFAAKMEEYEKANKDYQDSLSKKEAWVTRPEKPIRPSWLDEKREKEFSLQTPIKPGVWNDIEVHVTPATLEQLDNIDLSIETKTIGLNNK